MSKKPNIDLTDTQPVRNIARALASRSGVLDARLLANAREVEITATDSRTGAVRDRAWTKNLAALKRFVLRNRQCRFTLRITADGDAAQPILDALGPSLAYDALEHPGTVVLRERPWERARRQAIVSAENEKYAWRGVTVTFPRDPTGRATIRNALVILTIAPSPHSSTPVSDNPAPPAQGRLGF